MLLTDDRLFNKFLKDCTPHEVQSFLIVLIMFKIHYTFFAFDVIMNTVML